jgi:hypothetical protein
MKEGYFLKPIEKNEKKKEIWNDAIIQIDKITDRLGKPIDAGIKDSVVAFIVSGFPVNGSCEGHLEERFGEKVKLRPYVMIGFDEPEQRFVNELEIKKHIAKKYNIKKVGDLEENDIAQQEYWRFLSEKDIPETPEYSEHVKKNESLQEELRKILEVFYRNREISRDRRLIIEEIGPAGDFKLTTLMENPKEIQENEVEKYKKQLREEQNEMKDFTLFLKERFFNKE